MYIHTYIRVYHTIVPIITQYYTYVTRDRECQSKKLVLHACKNTYICIYTCDKQVITYPRITFC